MEVGVEFHSLSKTYSMTGWRIGFCVGNARCAGRPRQDQDQRGLGRVPGGAGGGHRRPHRAAGPVPSSTGASTRSGATSWSAGLKRARLGGGRAQGRLLRLGAGAQGLDSRTFAARLLDEVGCVVTPGVGFGPSGRGLLPYRAHHRRQAPGRGHGAAPGAQALSSDKIFLEDVRFYGHHGVTKAQQTVGAWFSVDAELLRGPGAGRGVGRSPDHRGLRAGGGAHRGGRRPRSG